MKSRLETIDPRLATEISASPLADARAEVARLLSKTLTTLPQRAVSLLPKNFEIQSHKVSQGQIDALDDRYFDLEETGDAAGSTAAFMAARFLAAVKSWQTATTQFDLCEAAYDARLAADPRR